jgi:putative acetyltransferase
MDTSLLAVRPATIADADQIADAHVDSIHALGAKAYDRDVIEVWGAPRDGQRYRAAIEQGELFFIAVEGRQVLGFSSYRLEEGKHRTAIYVRGIAARRGIGTALFVRAEAAARERGAGEIYVDASLAAVDFYRSCGFQELGVGEHLLPSGVAMACVFMRKTLGAATPVGLAFRT